VTRCSCGGRLTAGSHYTLWSDALVVSHAGEIAGIPLGAATADLLRWVPNIRERLRGIGSRGPNLVDAAYAVAHYIYVLTDYRQSALPRGIYREERQLLHCALDFSLAHRDLELLCECFETLSILGDPAPKRLERVVHTLIADCQGADGGWAPGTDSCTRYHTTWTCLDALRPHRRPARRTHRPVDMHR
jgi:hypothetical protein